MVMKAMKRVSPPSTQPVAAVDSSRGPVLRPSSAKVVRYSCLYTKQVNKKRKVWSDGVLKVLVDGESLYHCTLVDLEDVREVGLDSRQLEPAEIARFREKKPHLLELESHIVDLSFDEISGNNDKDSITAAPLPSAPLKLPKFVPPSRCVRPAQSQSQTMTSSGGRALPQTQVLAHTQQIAPSKPPSASFGGKNYTLNEDELDDIWGTAKPSPNVDSRSSYANNDMNINNTAQEAPRRGETVPGWDDGETFIESRSGLSRSTLDSSSSSFWTSSSGVSNPDNKRNEQNLNRGGFNQTNTLTSSSVLRENPQNALGLDSFLTNREREDEHPPQNDLNKTSSHQDNEEEWDFQHAWMPSVDQSNAANIRSAIHVDESIWD